MSFVPVGTASFRNNINLLKARSVASAARARRNFARLREQYKLVRERIARNSNAAIAERSSF